MGSLKKTAHCSNFQKIRFTAEKQQIKKFKFWGLSPLFKNLNFGDCPLYLNFSKNHSLF